MVKICSSCGKENPNAVKNCIYDGTPFFKDKWRKIEKDLRRKI